jgi:phospholipid-translocating ATPase
VNPTFGHQAPEITLAAPNEKETPEPRRHVRVFSQPDTFCTNRIRTARFTWWNFIPIAIYLQFCKLVNTIWFIVIVINMHPDITIGSPVVANLILSTVFIIGILKEGISDLRRHLSDKKINQQRVRMIKSDGTE